MQQQLHILLVEDDLKMAKALQVGLKEQNYRVTLANSCQTARSKYIATGADLIILDLGLPDGDGIDWLQELRQSGQATPVLIVTARDAIDDKVRGLDAGGDDYLPKPFAFNELLARIRVLTRRTVNAGTCLNVGCLHIDLLARQARRGDVVLELAPLEFDVLTYLAHKAGTTISRDTLMREVWKIHQRATSMDNVIDVLMTRLREKIDKPFSFPLIKTIRGIGYQLQVP